MKTLLLVGAVLLSGCANRESAVLSGCLNSLQEDLDATDTKWTASSPQAEIDWASGTGGGFQFGKIDIRQEDGEVDPGYWSCNFQDGHYSAKLSAPP